ncbi:tetratricopeptide repeat protein [Lentzea alba]|uniref:NB-ARC domain-containing protein n=1 Tax=Lentzea alba TaxID=2714351 RepID=UPI0039BF8B3C
MDRASPQQLDCVTGTLQAVPDIPAQVRGAQNKSSRIVEELAALRQSYGLFAHRVDTLIGPDLRVLCGVTDGDDPEEVRWKVEVWLRDLSAQLPDNLRTAVFGAFAIHPATRSLTYPERVRWTSRRLDLDDHATRRAIAESVRQLAALASSVQVMEIGGRRPAVHRTILVLDVEGFGDPRRTNANQVVVRRGLYRSVRSALDAAGIPRHRCDVEDRGDGVFLLAGGDVPKAAFVESFPLALADALRRHNKAHAAAEHIRLRMALHAGEISYDDYGVTAASVNLAFRLLDAPALRNALATSPGVLAVIVSSWFFEEVVWQSSPEDAATYRHTEVQVKETRASAWISLPDNPFPHDEVAAAGLPRTSEVPQQLPCRPRSFTGRAADLAVLTGLVLAEPEHERVVTVVGMGGIGKTWLVLHWAHLNAGRYPDGHLYVDLRGFDPSCAPVEPAVAVRGFLDVMRVPPDSIPTTPEAQVALYQSLVAGKKMLIVLDNARDSSQVVPLLPGRATCTVLVTSRNHLTSLVVTREARPLPLTTLSGPESHELLAKRLGGERIGAEPLAVADLVASCAGLPLALGIVAAHAATHADLPLEVLAAELGEASARLDVLDGGEVAANLRAVLSWSYAALDPEAAEVFRLLSLAPGPDVGPAAARVVTAQPADRFAVLIRQLVNAHLVQRNGSARYRVHDLVRLYAAEQAGDDGVVALRRLIGFYVHASYAGERLLYPDRKPIDVGAPVPDVPVFADDVSALAWFDVELPCLLAAQQAAAEHGWHDLVWQLAWSLHGYLWRRGHLPEQLATWGAALAAAEHLGDPAKQGLAHRLLGQACARGGTSASEHLRRALELARQAGDVHGEARAHHDFAWISRHDDPRGALDHAVQALRLFRTLDNPVWEAEALSTVAWQQAHLGAYREARASCSEAQLLFGKHGNRHGQAVTLDCLGFITLHCGRPAEALGCFEKALVLLKDLGATYDEAGTTDNLGLAHAALGHHADARQAWQRALALTRIQHRVADAERIERHLAELDALR